MWARPTRAPSTWRGAGLAAQLVHELDDLAERRRAERLALRQQAAARVHRPGAAERDRAVGEQPRLLARRAQAELVVREQLAGRVGVLALDDVEVVGPDARFLVRVAAASVDGGVMSVSSMPDERRRLAEHAAGQVRAQPRRRERHRAPVAPSARRSTTAAAPSLGEHSIQRCSGSHTSARREHLLGGHRLAEHRVRVVHAVGAGSSRRPRARWSFVSPCSRSSRCARSAKYAGVAASPASSRHGSKNDERMMPFGIFSTPNTSTQSYWPARIAPAASCSAAPPLAQPGLDVDDRHAGARERAEHLVAGRDAAVRGAAERGLERRIAGLGERGAHRVHAHVGVRRAVEAAERMDADAGDLDAS